MISIEEIFLKWICPAAGTIIAVMMFSAAVRDVCAATREGRLGDLNPTPWAFQLGNCCGWLAYSYIIQDPWVCFANAVGFLVAVWLNIQAGKLQYGEATDIATRQSIALALHEHESKQSFSKSNRTRSLERRQSLESLIMSSRCLRPTMDCSFSEREDCDQPERITGKEIIKIVWDVTAQNIQAPVMHERLVFWMVIIWTTIITIVGMGTQVIPASTSRWIVGGAGILNLIFFYGAPLSTIAEILKTRSSATVHVPSMLTSTANGSFWFAYGVYMKDYLFAAPNGLGALLGIVQMVLCALFPRRSRRNKVDAVFNGPSDLEEAVAEDKEQAREQKVDAKESAKKGEREKSGKLVERVKFSIQEERESKKSLVEKVVEYCEDYINEDEVSVVDSESTFELRRQFEEQEEMIQALKASLDKRLLPSKN